MPSAASRKDLPETQVMFSVFREHFTATITLTLPHKVLLNHTLWIPCWSVAPPASSSSLCEDISLSEGPGVFPHHSLRLTCSEIFFYWHPSLRDLI